MYRPQHLAFTPPGSSAQRPRRHAVTPRSAVTPALNRTIPAPERSSPVVSTKLRARIEHFAAAFCIFGKLRAQRAVSMTPPAMTGQQNRCFPARACMIIQRIPRPHLQKARAISARVCSSPPLLRMVLAAGFQTGKTKIQPRTIGHRARKDKNVRAVPCDAIFDSVGHEDNQPQ